MIEGGNPKHPKIKSKFGCSGEVRRTWPALTLLKGSRMQGPLEDSECSYGAKGEK